MPLPDKAVLIKRMLVILNTPCIYCTEKLTISTIGLDHVLPVARSGTNHESNIQFICQKCNRRKGVFTHEEYQSLLKFLSVKKREEMKKILLKRLGMSNFRWGR